MDNENKAIQGPPMESDRAPRLRFALVGGGFRSEWYLRTASLIGPGCAAIGLVSRGEEKREVLARKWGIPVYADVRALLDASAPDFLLVAVAGEASARVLGELLPLGVPLLAETPPAASLNELEALWAQSKASGTRIQVAEQYWLHPLQQARLSAVAEGLIGKPSYVHASVNHGYHNISLIRKYLDVGFAPAELRAVDFTAPVLAGPDRAGPPAAERLTRPEHRLALLDFGGERRGLYDFETGQHRSWIRTERLLVRGERGELADSRLVRLRNFATPLYEEFKRIQTGGDGDFEDYHLKGIQLGGRWIYRNPTAPYRLSDEEIGQAVCLYAMKRYIDGGLPFYSLSEAAQDQYLALLLKEAAETGRTLIAERRSWAEER